MFSKFDIAMSASITALFVSAGQFVAAALAFCVTSLLTTEED